MDIDGSINCFEPPPGIGFDGLRASDCVMTQYWVELPDAKAREEYLAYLTAHVAE